MGGGILLKYEFVTAAEGIEAAISENHRFTTDSVLLSRFCAPKKDEAAAEFCCGCGFISLLWFGRGETPPKSVIGFDIMDEAIALFNLSIEKNRLGGRVDAVRCDLNGYRAEPLLPANSFDLIACNPPYFEAGLGGGPRQAARQETSLDIFSLCRAAAYALKFGGRLCLCFKPQRLPDLMEAMRQSGIEPKILRPVLIRPGEPPHLLLTEGRRGGRAQLDWLPPLILQRADGSFSDEYREIYRMR